MSETVVVEVKSDHLARLASVRSPIAAVVELIWNSLDADAKRVSVAVARNILGGIESIRVVDDGHGMSRQSALQAFGSLGGSSKREGRKSTGGRFQHGRLGRGRFKAFALGTEVQWATRYRDGKQTRSFEVLGTKENLASFTFSDVEEEKGKETGTSVIVTGIVGVPPTLESGRAIEALAGEFALYLRQYPDATLTFDGARIDPGVAVSQETNQDLPPVVAQDGTEFSATLTIVEWNIPVERSLFLCDSSGLTFARLPVNIHAPRFNFTAYVRSDFVRRAENEGTFGLEEASPELVQLADAARSAVKAHFREREARRAETLVSEWKNADVYPYPEPPKTAAEQVEQQVFDVVALSIHSYLPNFEEGTASSKRLTFRLMRQALESDASSLQRILRDVLDLPREKQDELAQLLERTSLSAIIAASKIVGDRLDFLRALESIVFEEPTRTELRERDQLHRIIADNTWVFGEHFNLSVDDQSLTEVLRAHCTQLGIEVLDDRPVLREDGSRGIVDLMLSRTIPQPRAEVREHLVVELKRPSVVIGQAELSQVESYAHAIVRDERFRGTDTRWEFWALSNDLSDIVADKANQPGKPEGLVTELGGGRAKIWIKTWAQVIRGASSRLQFFQEKLAYGTDTNAALAFLRETYARYLPPEPQSDVQ